MRSVIATPHAPKAIGCYSQGISISSNGSVVFISGQIPINPATGVIEETTVEGQARVALTNLTAVLAAVGATPENVVKTTVLIRDMNDFSAVNSVYASFFTTKTPPARACFATAGLPKDALVEIEAVAVIPDASVSTWKQALLPAAIASVVASGVALLGLSWARS